MNFCGGGGGGFDGVGGDGLASSTVSYSSPSASIVVKYICVRYVWGYSNSYMNHYGQQKTDKAYNEAKMTTRQKQRAETLELRVSRERRLVA